MLMEIAVTKVIGIAATIVGTCIPLPQIWKSCITKKVDDLSMLTIIFYIINCVLWREYGVLIAASPVKWANGIGIVLGFIQLGLKLKYRTRKTS